MVIAALAVPIWLFYFASSQGRFFLASEGFLSEMPDALWFGLTFGVFTAAFFLALGYVYADARRRDMPAWAWVIAAAFIPNFVGFVLCSEGLYTGLAAHAASQFEGEKRSALTADARRVPVSEAAQPTIAQNGGQYET
jgi:hypothetical protein